MNAEARRQARTDPVGHRGHRHAAVASALFLVLLSSWLCQASIAGETGRRLPRLLVPTVPSASAERAGRPGESVGRATAAAPVRGSPAGPQLNWRNGETLAGEFKGVDAQCVIWKTPMFTEAMRVRRAAIRRLDFPGETIGSEDPFRLVLADGTHLTGAITGIDERNVSFKSRTFGEVAVRRDQIAAIERLRGEGIIEAGPAELLTGTPTSKGRISRLPPYLATAGRPVFLEFNGGVGHAIDLPEKCLVELRLRIEAEPAFSLTLTDEASAVSLETWGDELVLLQKERFVSAGKASSNEDGLFHLRLAWDRPAGRCVLFGDDGKPLVEILDLDTSVQTDDGVACFPDMLSGLAAYIGPVVEEVMRDPKILSWARLAGRTKGLTLVNSGSGFVVERYLLADWLGGPLPAMVREETACVETAGEIMAGEPVALNGDALVVRSADGAVKDVALSAVRAIRWPRKVSGERDPALTDIWYLDGNLLRGTLAKVSEGNAHVESAFTNAPIVASLERCRAVLLPDSAEPTTANPPAELPLEKLDVIAAGGLVLHGSIKLTGKPLPEFQPTGCDIPLTPVPTETLTLTRSLPSDRDYERAPALLHLKRNESLPVSVVGLSGDRIEFVSSGAERGSVPSSDVHAVQFTVAPSARTGGFDGPGWRPLGRSSAVAASGSSVVLEAGGGMGNSYLLHGDDFSFSFGKDGQLTALRVRLFCQGTEPSSDSMNFLLSHYGSQIYCGLELTRDGAMESTTSIEIGGDTAAVPIEFRFGGDGVELLVNHVSAIRSGIRGKIGRKTGAGLIIETASFWGNRIGPAKLSDFSMRSSLDLVSPPRFSDDAKREALMLPRLRRELPPRQILIGRNGDLLRGEMETMAPGSLRFRVGLDHFNVPMNRIAAAVWVEQADKTMEDNLKKKPTQAEGTTQPGNDPAADPAAKPAAAAKPAIAGSTVADAAKPTAAAAPPAPVTILPADTPQWLDLTNGGRLELKAETWTAQGVAGRNPSLGQCLIPADLVYRIALKSPPPAGALAALSGWKFQNTPDPNPPGLEESDTSPLVGKPAIDFTLTMLDGKEFSLSKAKGKVIVLDFWATWCGPCIRSLPPLIASMATFPPDKVAFVAVNQGESKEQVRRFLQIRGLDMPVAFDSDMAVGGKYGAEAIPYTVVIDPAGTVCHVSMGETRDGDKKIATAVTKAAAL